MYHILQLGGGFPSHIPSRFHIPSSFLPSQLHLPNSIHIHIPLPLPQHTFPLDIPCLLMPLPSLIPSAPTSPPLTYPLLSHAPLPYPHLYTYCAHITLPPLPHTFLSHIFCLILSLHSSSPPLPSPPLLTFQPYLFQPYPLPSPAMS